MCERACKPRATKRFTKTSPFHPPKQSNEARAQTLKWTRQEEQAKVLIEREDAKNMRGTIPIVVGDVECVTTRGYFDTGAEESLIDVDFAARVFAKGIRHPSEPERYQGIGGVESESQGRVSATIAVGIDKVRLDMGICKLPGIDIILGKDWIYELDVGMSPRTSELILPHSTVHCDLSPPKRRSGGFAQLVKSVRLGGRTHDLLPSCMEVGDSLKGMTVIVTPVTDVPGLLLPQHYIATVDPSGRIPLFVSNVSARKAHVKVGTVACTYELLEPAASIFTVKLDRSMDCEASQGVIAASTDGVAPVVATEGAATGATSVATQCVALDASGSEGCVMELDRVRAEGWSSAGW